MVLDRQKMISVQQIAVRIMQEMLNVRISYMMYIILVDIKHVVLNNIKNVEHQVVEQNYTNHVVLVHVVYHHISLVKILHVVEQLIIGNVEVVLMVMVEYYTHVIQNVEIVQMVNGILIMDMQHVEQLDVEQNHINHVEHLHVVQNYIIHVDMNNVVQNYIKSAGTYKK